jgi:hypothetical protein
MPVRMSRTKYLLASPRLDVAIRVAKGTRGCREGLDNLRPLGPTPAGLFVVAVRVLVDRPAPERRCIGVLLSLPDLPWPRKVVEGREGSGAPMPCRLNLRRTKNSVMSKTPLLPVILLRAEINANPATLLSTLSKNGCLHSSTQ